MNELRDHHYPDETRIGLLSDSHGQVEMTAKAVKMLVEEGQAEVLVHCGDIGSKGVLEALARPGLPVHIVFGNCDYNHAQLREEADRLGIFVDDPVGRIKVGDRSLVFTHGHDFGQEPFAVAARAAFFCHGHSHEVRDEVIEWTRILNPGALLRATRYNVMVVEPTPNRVRLLNVPRG